MRIYALAAALIVCAGAAVDGPPAMPGDVEGYTLVRDDVLAELNAAHDKLPACEQSLASAADDVMVLKADGVAARAAADKLRASVDEHRRHIDYQQSVIDELRKHTGPGLWEELDGALGVAGGYALGTGMCVGLAWVFNQPDFAR